MRIGFVTMEIFHWGRYGGFGKLTRTIGKNLVSKGLEVYVITERFDEQRPVEILDGMVVLSYPRFKNVPFFYFGRVFSQYSSRSFYKICDADVFHSQAVHFQTYTAFKTTPKKKHIITFQDPYDEEIWQNMIAVDPNYRVGGYLRRKLNYQLIKKTCQIADAIYCQAKYIIPKVMKMYDLKQTPKFLPNPIEIPKKQIKKSDTPTVCFLARWDPQKRVEIFFNLAKEFPDVKFIALGRSHNEKEDHRLREKYSNIPNLEMTGFVSEERKSEILGKSWIMANTSIHECLPVSFLEACVYQTSILSSENPDNFARDFGFHVKNDDYVSGLKFLLETDLWRERGEKGYEYVKETHELNKVIDKHVEVYRSTLE